MKMKGLLRMSLSMLLVWSMLIPTTAFAGIAVNAEQSVPVRVYGTIVEKSETQITIQNSNKSDPLNKITLNIGDETLILDAVDGSPVDLKDLRKNETVYAYVSPAMTRSIPPQSNAFVIFCSIPAGFGVPSYTAVTNVKEKSGDIILSTDLDIDLTISDDTEIFAYGSKNIVTKEDVTKGSEIVAWYGAVQQSSPAKAVPSKIMLLNYKVQDEMPGNVRVYGYVADLWDNSILLKNSNPDDPYNEVVVHIGDDTLVLNAVSGLNYDADKIRKGDTIYAYIGPAMTMSLPPQSTAEVILAGIPADFGVPAYVTVTDIRDKYDDLIVNTDKDFGFIVTDDTEIFAYRTKNIVTRDDIDVGSELLVWYSFTDENNSRMSAEKVMLFPKEAEPDDTEEDKDKTDEGFFIDVPEDHWAYDEIMYFYNKGIIAGIGDSKFNPDGKVTREEFAKMLAIIFERTDAESSEQTFSDVPSDRWSHDYIEAVKEYLTGYYPNGADPFFNPAAKAKREDIAYALVKINSMDSDITINADKVLGVFRDADDVSPALKEHMAIAVELGLIKGDGQYLRPQDSITRAEAVTLLFRAIKSPVDDDGIVDKDDGKDNGKGEDDNDNKDDDKHGGKDDGKHDNKHDGKDDDFDDKEIGKFDFMITSGSLSEFSMDDEKDYNDSKGNVLFKWSDNKAEFSAKILLKTEKSGVSDRIDITLTKVIEIDDDELEGYFNITFNKDETKRVKAEISIDDGELEFDADDFEFSFKNLKRIKK